MMPEKLKQVRKKLEQLKGKKSLIRENLTIVKLEVRGLKAARDNYEQAREIVRTVGLMTQQSLQYHISDITTLALSAVFPDDPYQLNVEFLQRRNKTECDLFFERSGKLMEPLEASGYGAVDVAAFALRIASWSMKIPKSRNVIILDEPMRFLSEDRQTAASQMIKELADKLGLQFIIVTHEDVLTQYADRVFQVAIKDGVSKVISNSE